MSHPPFKVLDYASHAGVCTLTLNRPERRNALSLQLVNELIVALEAAGDDDAVRVIVLQGAGGVFCSGGDLAGLSAPDPAMPQRGGFVELNLAFTQLGKPVIAKVRRYALAGGLGLMCACTFAIAEDTASFGTPEIDRGLFPMMIMANIFRTVPRRVGLELLLTGERIDAARAVQIGLINRAVAPAELDATVDALARQLATKPPNAMRLGLQAYYAQDGVRLEVALPMLETALMDVFKTPDAAEGMRAFLEKRRPSWDAG